MYLCDWLNSVDISKVIPDLMLDKNDKYLTFNYTETLEKIYNIPSQNILHIHGSIKSLEGITTKFNEAYNDSLSSYLKEHPYTIDEELEIIEGRLKDELDEECNIEIRSILQFGGSIPSSKQVLDRIFQWYNGDEGYQEYLSSSVFELNHLIDSCSKNTSHNYNDLMRFIEPDNEIDEVVVMGHSLNSVDDAYYTNILIPKLKDKLWIFWIYRGKGSNDEINVKDFIKKHKVNNYRLMDW